MGHHVAVNAGRILTNPAHAWQIAVDLHGWRDADGIHPGLTDHRRLTDADRRPHGVRVRCPACDSWVRLRDDDTIIRCPGTLTTGEPCHEWGTLDHWRKLVPDADQPMTAPALADWLWTHHRYRATPETIRQWASRGSRWGKLTRIETTLDGEHADGCVAPGCPGCLPGPARYDPVRAAEIVMMIRAWQVG